MTASATHLVLLPAFNPGPRLHAVVAEVLAHWQPVLVVVDGSTDGSEQPVLELARTEPALSVLVLPHNGGKGAAVLAGAQAAAARGFTHALVMDSDAQHPAGSIAEFMAASLHQPAALILGQPIFPANIPVERLHGRKLSTALVHVELLGNTVSDPLFGFRVYPLAPLLAALGPRRSARRYDFDTEAAVRLVWAGLPAVNLPAPVRYFSRAEGGVSHFHYLRDNVTLVWMHLRLLAELLCWRWPTVVRQRRRWRAVTVALTLLLAGGGPGYAAGTDPLIDPAHQLTATAPAWRDLVEAFRSPPDTVADFTERRRFAFKKDPVVLQGEVRVSAPHGLSLHYTAPDERTVILDDHGMLIRAPTGQKAPPADPRAAAANEALRRILRFDLPGLDKEFELYGQRQDRVWTLTLVPRTAALRRSVGQVTVIGEAASIRDIEIRRSATQVISISLSPPRPSRPFTAKELRAFFR